MTPLLLSDLCQGIEEVLMSFGMGFSRFLLGIEVEQFSIIRKKLINRSPPYEGGRRGD